jgi:hypothetical protein
MCLLLRGLKGHIRVIYLTSRLSVSSWPPELPSSPPDVHWLPLEACHLGYTRIASTCGVCPLTCEEGGWRGGVMRWCYYGRVRGRCSCCRVHHRPLLRSLSTPTGPCNHSLRVFKMKTTAHRKKNQRGFVLLTSRSGFPGLWPNPKGPTKGFRLVLSCSKVMTSFLLTFARELSTTKDQF